MAAPESTSGGTYLYAIAKGPVPSRFTAPAVEAGAGAIRSLHAGPLAAVVSDAPPRPIALTRANIRAHSEAIQELLETASAVVPLKFGTVFPDDETIRRDLLDEGANGLEPLLRRLENRVEFRVKAFYVEETVLREVLNENRAAAELNRRTRLAPADAVYYDSIQLGELVTAALGRTPRRGRALRRVERRDGVVLGRATRRVEIRRCRSASRRDRPHADALALCRASRSLQLRGHELRLGRRRLRWV